MGRAFIYSQGVFGISKNRCVRASPTQERHRHLLEEGVSRALLRLF